MLVAVSSCLMGNPVRYDGRSKSDDYILNRLSDYCDFKPICPEHEAFGTPRQTIHIEYDPHDPIAGLSVIDNVQKIDVTEPLKKVINQHLVSLKTSGVCGVILKSKSPSCGFGSTPLYTQGMQYDTGDGLFAHALVHAFPYLPIIEETGLNSSWKRDQFLLQLFMFADLQNSVTDHSSRNQLRTFHEKHRLLLTLKNQSLLQSMDEKLLSITEDNLSERVQDYQMLFKLALATGNTSVQCASLLTDFINTAATARNTEIPEILITALDKLKHSHISLVDMVTQIRGYFEQIGFNDYREQSLLEPYPAELAISTT